MSNDECILWDVVGCLIMTERKKKIHCCAEMTLHPVQLGSVNMSSGPSSPSLPERTGKISSLNTKNSL